MLLIILRYNPIFGQKLVHLAASAEGRVEPLSDVREYGKGHDNATHVEGSAVSVKNEDNVWNSDSFAGSTFCTDC
jgi:hypothetical protein